MARIAFVMDKPLRRIGLFRSKHRPDARRLRLHRPGVMATRTLLLLSATAK